MERAFDCRNGREKGRISSSRVLVVEDPYIGLVKVNQEKRGQGVGRAMLRFLEEFLRENEFRVLMSSSQVNEPRAQEWHRKMGFQESGIVVGINKGGIGEVFFTKPL